MITITQGDEALLQLTATTGDGNPINLTGATFSTSMKGLNGAANPVFPDGQHDIVDAANGIFELTLSPADTALVGEGTGKEILTKITIAGNPVYYHGFNQLTVYAPVPLQ